MFTAGAYELSRARDIGGLDQEKDALKHNGSGALSRQIAKGNLYDGYLQLAGFAGWSEAKAKKIIAIISLYSLACLLLAASGKLLFIAAFFISPFALWLTLARAQFKRAELFERDYPTLLISLASSVRTGLDPTVALSQSERLFSPSSEVRRAINCFTQLIDSGAPEERAIGAFARDISHPDLDLFRTAFILARRHGSSLAHCLHRLTKVTRNRQSFRRKMRAAVAMQKLSAVGIALSACAIALIQYLSSPQAINAAFQHPVGYKLMLLGISLLISGIIWMMSMARSKL